MQANASDHLNADGLRVIRPAIVHRNIIEQPRPGNP
jgi:hypothetical protein